MIDVFNVAPLDLATGILEILDHITSGFAEKQGSLERRLN